MKADSWILRQLPELLVKDWFNFWISTEFDVHVATYHHLRKEFGKERSDRWIIKAQPYLRIRGADVKPDIVIYQGTIPRDVIELKCQLNGFQKGPIEKDIEKLRKLKESKDIRHAYMLVLYDDAVMELRNKEPWMKNFLTFVSVNVRYHPNGRLRRNYDKTRERWEEYYRHS